MAGQESLDPDRSMWDFIAVELRRQRRARGVSGASLARLIGRDRSIVSRIESGRIPMQLDHAEIIDREWGLDRLFTRLVRFAKERKDDEWRLGDLAEQEARATRVRLWEIGLVPGLLQTPDYARAVLSVGLVRDPDEAVQGRLSRQAAVFDRERPPEVSVILNWAVLEQPVGSADVMRGQLARLLELAELPHVSVRVLEKSAGVHVGYDGMLELLTVDARDLAYAEAPHGGGLVTDPADVQDFEVRYDRIGNIATPAGSSRAVIHHAMETCR
ncbi:transcriptional regulator with XRE-family HTH domain [Actinomadura coerulea]|uniref:Transcriptional regulator with XRE-family HTH domain n=1 Tax=Actinomadura coerulea TaxID=46159 RepID=A0A7X0G8C4_9ACTN|nr:helix-turn-helix transcriptional regulator [Actinomadura coerulea]MBB6400552.1 transcriptional regulator with XRE-family HTH domain [Actinomadura coerulea]GGQ08070.1 transcriptional regulator [Actinomadura coerulea]